jgi:hypothetical protein
VSTTSPKPYITGMVERILTFECARTQHAAALQHLLDHDD